MDRDASSSITRAELDCEEFRSIIRSIMAPKGGDAAMGGAHYARAEMNMTQAINFCLRKADLNDDATLSFEEFRAFVWGLRHQHLTSDTASLIFALFDLDQDGLLSEAEFREVWRFYLGRKPTEAEFREEWSRLDRDAHGQVTRREYCGWLRSSANPVFRQHAPTLEPEPAQQAPSPDGASSLLLRKLAPRPRPLWNHRLDAATPGVRTHATLRTYFSRPQSLPELTRHLETHRGCDAQRHRLMHHKEPIAKTVLSTDKGYEFHPERAQPGGSMRSRSTGRLSRWEDHWQTPLCVRPQHKPGTLLLRASEPPPRWMLDYKSDFELPQWAATGAGPPPPGAGALLVVGPGGAGGAALAEGLCAEAPRALGPGLPCLGRGRRELGRSASVLALPGAGGGAAGAAGLAALLEQCLLDARLLGGIAGLVVGCDAAAGRLGTGALVVQAVLREGCIGHDRWANIVLCGVGAALGPDEDGRRRILEAGMTDAFFGDGPGPRGPALAVGPGSLEAVLAALQGLTGAKIRFRRPGAAILADALAGELGLESAALLAELGRAREAAAALAGQLRAGAPGAGLVTFKELAEALPRAAAATAAEGAGAGAGAGGGGGGGGPCAIS